MHENQIYYLQNIITETTMAQGKCNLFKPVDNPTGTFFLFSQYTQDLTKQYSNPDTYRCLPSKFVALNLDFSNIQKAEGLSKNQILGTIFQNYFENACTFLRDRYSGDSTLTWNPEYSRTLLFQTLEKYKMIKNDEVTETDNGAKSDGTTGKTYGATSAISRNIQYIGDINIYSNVDGEKGVGYNEIYCYIPNEAKCQDYDIVATNHLTSYFYGDVSSEVYPTIMGYKGSVPFNGLGANSYKVNGSLNYMDNSSYGCGTYNTGGVGAEDLNTLIPYVLKTKVDERTDTQTAYDAENIAGKPREDTSFKVNAIIVLYDIIQKTTDITSTTLYRNIPLGIYFTGCLDDNSNEMTNTITKYVSNDAVYGQGTSYGLRICTRFLANPNSNATVETTAESSTNTHMSEIAPVLEQFADTITGMNDLLDNEDKFHQTIKDHLSNFKNNKVNVPYVRQLGTKKYWFVNGKNTGAIAQFEMSDPKDIVNQAVKAVLEQVYSKDQIDAYVSKLVTREELNAELDNCITSEQMSEAINVAKNDIIKWLKVYLNGE